MNKYSIGELAKITNTSKKAIRYYQDEGLVSPSSISLNGYAEYSDKEKIIIEKINALRFFGISVPDIREILDKEDKEELISILTKHNLKIQAEIEELNSLFSIMNKIITNLDSQNERMWEYFIKAHRVMNMNRMASQGYADGNDLRERICLHKSFLGKKTPWFDWVMVNINPQKGEKILEVACGDGELWKQNKEILSRDLKVVLSDVSIGMLREAKRNVGIGDNIKYVVADMMELPFEDNSFDKVIANHALFYAENVEGALKEMKRVLIPNGTLYCTTYGQNHMKEIEKLVKKFDSRIYLSNINLYEIFGKENGKEILSKEFNNIEEYTYDDEIAVDDYEILKNYICACHGNQNEIIESKELEFDRFLNENCSRRRKLKVIKEASMFSAKKY